MMFMIFLVLLVFPSLITSSSYTYQWCNSDTSICQSIPTSTCLNVQSDTQGITHVYPAADSSFGSQPIQVTKRVDIELGLERRDNFGIITTEAITTEITRILLTEALGYSVSIHQYSDFSGDFLTRCAQPNTPIDFYMEMYGLDDNTPSQWATALAAGVRIVGPNGMIANNGWYITGFTVRQHLSWDMDFWRAYARPEVIALLPQINATQARMDTTSGRSYFIPPQCDPLKGGRSTCGMFLGVSSLWDQGIIQGQIRNLNLSLILMFPKDFDEYTNIVTTSLKNHTHLLFELWTPSLEEVTYDVIRIQLPPLTPTCFANRNMSMDGINSINCDFVPATIAKMACPRDTLLYSDPSLYITGPATSLWTPPHGVYARPTDHDDAASLISSFFYLAGDVPTMLDRSSKNSSLTIHDLACQYLINDRSNDWPRWIQKQIPRTMLQDMSTTQQTSAIVITSLYMFINFILIIGTLWYHDTEVIRATSVKLRIFHLIGGMFLYGSLLLGIDRSSSVTCMNSQLLLSLGFHLFYTTLVLKAQRIDHIFLSNKLHVAKVTDQIIMKRLGTLMLPDIIVIAIWWIAHPIAIDITQHDRNPLLVVKSCDIYSNLSVFFLSLVYLYRSVMLVMGLFLAYRIRYVNGHWNESKLVLMATYQSVLAAILGVATSLGLLSNDTNSTTTIYLVCISIGVCFPSISNGIHVIICILRPDLIETNNQTMIGQHTGLGSKRVVPHAENPRSSITTEIPIRHGSITGEQKPHGSMIESDKGNKYMVHPHQSRERVPSQPDLNVEDLP